MTDGDGVSVGDLPGLKRRQLMDMAKARGIRANQKTTVLVEELRKRMEEEAEAEAEAEVKEEEEEEEEEHQQQQ